VTLRGIDVSRWQGTINWAAVAASVPRVELAVIRATLGSSGIDDRYPSNWAAAKAAGIPRLGVYHYVIPGVDPARQAEHILTTITDFGTEPLTLDVERREIDKATPFDRIAFTRLLTALVLLLRPRVGLRIYTSASEWAAMTTLPEWAGEFPLWVADYRIRPAPAIPQGWQTWELWQFTGSGRLAGIAGAVDLNHVREPVAPPASVAEHAAAILGLIGGG
jgi:lysozyme